MIGGSGVFLRLAVVVFLACAALGADSRCPLAQEILPCQCKSRGSEVILSCQRSSLEELSLVLAIVARRVPIVDELMLEDNDISELPSRSFGTLAIRKLLLWNNGLERLAADTFHGLGEFLLELHIREPRLSEFPPAALQTLPALTRLMIEHTPVVQIPDLSSCRALTVFHVDGSLIGEVKTGTFQALPLLKSVQITHSQLERVHTRALEQLERLEHANFSGNALTNLHVGWLHGTPALRTLDLSSNRFQRILPVLESVKNAPALEKLYLDSNAIEVIPEINPGMFYGLQWLSLSWNRIHSVENKAFSWFPSLRILDLSFNRLSYYPGEVFAPVNNLERLNLGGNPFGNVENLNRLLSGLPKLKKLHLSSCGIVSIPKPFITHATMEYLSLRNNSLRNIASGALQDLPLLLELDLGLNNLTDVPGVFHNLPRLQKLDVSFNQLETISPGLFQELRSLRILNASHNVISRQDPQSLWQLPALEELDLSHNLLNYFDFSAVSNHRRLEKLLLQSNQIHRLPGFLEFSNLGYIDLSSNIISQIPDSLTNVLTRLEHIDLSNNELIDIPKLGRSEKLKCLRLAGNKITELNDQDLYFNRLLQSIDLSWNSIRYLPPRYFIQSTELREINLSGNNISDVAHDVFMNLNGLEKLNVSWNALSEIEGNVFSHSRNLRSLDLSHNNISHLSNDGVGLIDLQILDLSFNSIDDLAAFSLARMPAISELRLRGNRIQSIPARTFENSMAVLKIDLSENEIDSLRSSAFALLPNLQEIKLSRNRIRKIDRESFIDLLSLESIHLDRNNIERIDDDAFLGPLSIRSLNLSRNSFARISDSGIRNLLSLQFLDLSHNSIKEVDQRSLRRLERLVSLNLDHNELCTVAEGTFRHQQNLEILTVRHNSLRVFQDSALERGSLRDIALEGNPLSCDCHLLWLWQFGESRRNAAFNAGDQRWAARARSSRFYGRRMDMRRARYQPEDQDIVCKHPPEVAGSSLRSLNPSKLVCDARTQRIADEACGSLTASPTTTTELAKIDAIVAGIEPATGKTPTLYAAIKKQPNSTVTEEKSTEKSKEGAASLFGLTLPSLKMGLNLLPALVGAGSIAAELLKNKQAAPVAEKKFQVGSKPSRGPDREDLATLNQQTSNKHHFPGSSRPGSAIPREPVTSLDRNQFQQPQSYVFFEEQPIKSNPLVPGGWIPNSGISPVPIPLHQSSFTGEYPLPSTTESDLQDPSPSVIEDSYPQNLEPDLAGSLDDPATRNPFFLGQESILPQDSLLGEEAKVIPAVQEPVQVVTDDPLYDYYVDDSGESFRFHKVENIPEEKTAAFNHSVVYVSVETATQTVTMATESINEDADYSDLSLLPLLIDSKLTTAPAVLTTTEPAPVTTFTTTTTLATTTITLDTSTTTIATTTTPKVTTTPREITTTTTSTTAADPTTTTIDEKDNGFSLDSFWKIFQGRNVNGHGGSLNDPAGSKSPPAESESTTTENVRRIAQADVFEEPVLPSKTADVDIITQQPSTDGSDLHWYYRNYDNQKDPEVFVAKVGPSSCASHRSVILQNPLILPVIVFTYFALI